MSDHNQPHPNLRLIRPVKDPASFVPERVWVDGDYIYRYDSKNSICKRSPALQSATYGTMFFEVEEGAQPDQPQASTPLRPQKASARIVKPRFRRPQLSAVWRPAVSSLAIAAFMILVYPYLPEINYRFQQTQSHTAQAQVSKVTTAEEPVQGNRVIIPKIGVDTPIVEGSNLDVLDHSEGVWHQAGSLNGGNFVLAGHRFKYLPPNTSTLYNLAKLQAGDTIAVDWLGRRTVYKVAAMKTVSAREVSILKPTSKQHLTIYTCNDKKQTKRTVAVAELQP